MAYCTIFLKKFLLQQDKQGYTFFSSAIETQNSKIFEACLEILSTYFSLKILDNKTFLTELLKIQTSKKLTVFHLLLKSKNNKLLSILFEYIDMNLGINSVAFQDIISLPDSFGKNPFQNISYDELSYKNALILSNNSPSVEARNESLIRQSQAEIFHRYKADKYNIEGVQIWQPFRDYPRPPNYFEIVYFGTANPPYKKRQVEEERWIFESDYQPWVEAQGVEMEMIPLSSKKVASVAINLFLLNKEISSFHQAKLLNKSVNLSVREKKY